jgi:radical SAM superfamily enzyme YgiQ (UPF0313 family)
VKDNRKNSSDVLLVGYEEWENIGLRSIAAFLMKHGKKVHVQRYDGSLKAKILDAIRTTRPRIVGFSLIFQRMLYDFASLIGYLRSNRITAHFTMGGHFPTVEPVSTLDAIPGLNSVVLCEGEHTLLELCNYLDRPASWAGIRGIAYRDNGEIRLTPPRPLIRNLDDLPFPLRSDQTTTHRDLGICPVLSSRGCCYDCSFCSIHQFYNKAPGPRRRTRSPHNVVREMTQLFHQRGIRIYIFDDDDFIMKSRLQRQWIKDFTSELKKSGIADKIVWRVSCRIDDLEPEQIKRMMDAGLASIYIGIESGNEQGLKTFNKHYRVADIYDAIKLLYDIEIPFEFGFMILNPDSTFVTIGEDILFLKDIGSTGQAIVHFTKTVPYAGTPISRRLQQEGRLQGTLAAPDYTYDDPRLELLQSFFTQAFHFRNFDSNGLVERLRHAKFDTIVLKRLFSKQYDTESYANAIKDLICQANAQCLETMSMAVNFMTGRSEQEIFNNWEILERLAQQEKIVESSITTSLDWLMRCYNYPP